MESPPTSGGPDGSPLVLEYAPPRERLLRVGTLSYTRGGLFKLWAWLSLAGMAPALRSRVMPLLAKMMLKDLGASSQSIAWVTEAIPKAFSLVVGVIVANYSDGCRSRWGRRIPFIVVAVPILMLTIAAMGFSPTLGTYLHRILGGSSPGEQGCGIIAFAVLLALHSIAATVYGWTGRGLVNDVVPHRVMGRFLVVLGAATIPVGFIFNTYFLASLAAHRLPAFLVLSALYGVSLIVLTCCVKEGEYPPAPPRAEGRGVMRVARAAWGFVKECYGNPFYRWVALLLCLGDVACAAGTVFSLLHASNLHVDVGTYAKCYVVQSIFSMIMLYPIAMLADRFHPLRVCAVCLLLYGVAAVWSGLFIRDGTTFAVGFVAQGIFAMSYAAAARSLAYRLLARSRFLVLDAGAGIVAAVINIISMPLVGWVVDRMHGEYRYAYLVGAVYALLGLPVYVIVYRKFVALGGPNHFVAPGEDTSMGPAEDDGKVAAAP